MVVVAPEICRDMQLASQQIPRSDDNNESTFRFSKVQCNALPTTSTVVVPSDGAGDHTSKGNSGEHGTQHCMGEFSDIPRTSSRAIFNDKLMVHFSDKEPLDYGPSPISDKEQEE
jgi:hypothetical protein